ncbi:DUF3325 domain-containing protein [Pseudomonas anuradhapurensis]|uniref:DUF3325 domain-containing protein n=1 Tax=Pseudomonas anuradhapurensis TaxID=485870 RepID=UPI001646500C|nr:DUF3325 domain-containing protein [Pseudomonas anuradhapurensis]QXI47111.1 DUF3325 domain-containing protein [Pseudomonas anuradhapurensis]
MAGIALITFAGLVALCLAMQKHFTDLLERKPRPGQLRLLRSTGWLLLLASLVLSVHLLGWAHGLVQWGAVLMAGATVWVFGLPYLPRLLLGLAAASVVLGPLLVVYAG